MYQQSIKQPTSMIGFEAKTFCSIVDSSLEPPTLAKYRIVYFAETVLPAPDSPVTIIDWFFSFLFNDKNQLKLH